jgi:hypothetical protein
MSNLSLFLGVLVTFGLQALQTESARVVVKQQSAHAHLGRVVLSEHQQQLRKAALHTEASLVCGVPEIKSTINAAKSVRGVQGINWLSLKLTAKDGLKHIEKDFETLTLEVEELEQKIKELEEAAKWGDLPDASINEMLNAACRVDGFKNDDGDCGRAAEFHCGWTDQILRDEMKDIPFDAAVDAFRASAEQMFTGYKRLSGQKFGEHCWETLPNEECEDLCYSFEDIVIELSTSEASATNLAERETLDGVINKHKAKTFQLQDAKAAKEDCLKAQVELDAFAAQVGMLSATVKSSQRAVSKYRRTLRTEQMQLQKQIEILEEKRKELAKAKMIFDAASAQVEARKADVARMEAELERLAKALTAQLALVARLEQKITDIEAATEAGRLFKVELSVTLENSVEITVEAIHKPLMRVGVTPERSISQDFDDAELAAAPAMKETVRAVGEFCGTERIVNALTGMQLKGTTHQLDHICTGQDWDKMIEEAQGVVKREAEEVVGILTGEQLSVKADQKVPGQSTLKMRGVAGEPDGLGQAMAVNGGDEGGKFVKDYCPGWAVEVSDDGGVAKVGKMLALYQELGEAFNLVTADWQLAKEGAEKLQDQIKVALVEMKKLSELLQRAIAAKEVAETNMNEAQKLVDTAEELKKMMEGKVASAQTEKEQGDQRYDDAKDALLTEHKERTAALLQMLQELKKEGKGAEISAHTGQVDSEAATEAPAKPTEKAAEPKPTEKAAATEAPADPKPSAKPGEKPKKSGAFVPKVTALGFVATCALNFLA